jgi:HEAT repeat protein
MADLFLTLIWQITSLLAVLSLVVLFVLIIHRVFRNRHELKDTARRKELRQLALELMEYPERIIEARKEMSPSDRRLLLALFEELRKQLKGEYAERLIRLMRIMGLMGECLEQLKHSGWVRRVEAATLLGNFNDPNVVLGLYRVLEDPRMEVRIAAARSLARLRAVYSVREIIAALIRPGNKPSLAVTQVFRHLEEKHAPELRELLRNHSLSPTALTLAIDALGRLGDLKAVPELLEICDHPNLSVRVATMQALARLHDPRSVVPVMLAMTDSSWEVRANASRAAGKIGDLAALPILQHLLDDTNWWGRYHAAETLACFGNPGLVQLQAVAETGIPEAANMAWGVLRERGGRLV